LFLQAIITAFLGGGVVIVCDVISVGRPRLIVAKCDRGEGESILPQNSKLHDVIYGRPFSPISVPVVEIQTLCRPRSKAAELGFYKPVLLVI